MTTRAGILLVLMIAGSTAFVGLAQREGRQLLQQRLDQAVRAREQVQAERSAACQAARGRAEVYARAMGTPAAATEAIAAARELAPWVPYCGGPRITIGVIEVDAFQLRSYLITFAQGDRP